MIDSMPPSSQPEPQDPSEGTDPRILAEAIDRELRNRRDSDRAIRERAYLKSSFEHYGVSVPDTRSVVRSALRPTKLDHDAVITLAKTLWAPGRQSPRSENAVFERRNAATMVLI